MKLSNPHIHSFIIKIFLDEDAEASDRAIWHGYITHVPDGEQKVSEGFGRCFGVYQILPTRQEQETGIVPAS